MKKTLLLATAVILSSTAVVQAADLGVVSVVAPAAVMDANFDWTGFYVGAFGGAGFGKNNALLSPDYDGDGVFEVRENIDNIALEGGFFGVDAGYNWQQGQIVYGLEADFSVTNINGADDDENPVFNNGVAVDYETFSTVRGRVGIAADRLLGYATAGVAYATGHDTYTFSDLDTGFTADPVTNDFDQFGFVIGAGAEYALTDNISVKAEYLFANFGDAEAFDVDAAADFDVFGPGSDTFQAIEHSIHTVKVGLNLSF